MNRIFAALLSGLAFGSGIALSGMANPAKVLNFFDVFGTWDPSLAFVMGGALMIVTAIGYRQIFGRRRAPVLDRRFHLPAKSAIDRRLLGGSALFGIGWGIAGFCPGGAIPALAIATLPAALFLGAALLGMLLARWLRTRNVSLQTA